MLVPKKEFSPILNQKKAISGLANFSFAHSASPRNAKKGNEIAIQTDTGEYDDIPLALEQKVEGLMK